MPTTITITIANPTTLGASQVTRTYPLSDKDGDDVINMHLAVLQAQRASQQRLNPNGPVLAPTLDEAANLAMDMAMQAIQQNTRNIKGQIAAQKAAAAVPEFEVVGTATTSMSPIGTA